MELEIMIKENKWRWTFFFFSVILKRFLRQKI